MTTSIEGVENREMDIANNDGRQLREIDKSHLILINQNDHCIANYFVIFLADSAI